MKSNSNIFERSLATKKYHTSLSGCGFLVMKHNSNKFEIYLATKKAAYCDPQLRVIFWP
jgi:hypothetical protein